MYIDRELLYIYSCVQKYLQVMYSSRSFIFRLDLPQDIMQMLLALNQSKVLAERAVT